MDCGKELLCGGVAGTIGVFCGLPLDLVKVRMQNNPSKYRYSLTYSLTHLVHSLTHSLTHLLTHSIPRSFTHTVIYPFNYLLNFNLIFNFSSAFRCFMNTVRHEGVAALFRGMMTPISTQCVINSIIFSTESLLFKELEKLNTEKSKYKGEIHLSLLVTH